ncbi:MAG: MFS transporter [Gammaproteobacteria bacterium]|nr:MFS transporter [Gammaproteobacteria bacterium]MDP2139834.1 MFS transporter [Gammaproteobacteria bacterium]MDP2347075.1 MFS transporter [Gammaproteobacteria bacterium]
MTTNDISDSEAEGKLKGNLTRFVYFRLFYNARFYYPIFTILFLDYGLTLEQFAILNLVWALTIVVAEVPSGALADIIGRKRLLVTAASLMVVEMLLLVLVPMGASPLLFSVFLLNRICSGLSEAAASGADEALVYDSLKALGRESEWAQLLERTTTTVSIGFFVTMISGALLYDAGLVNGVLGWLHADWSLSAETVIRLPIVFTLLNACVVLVITLGFKEPTVASTGKEPHRSLWQQLLGPFRQIMAAARWTLGHRFVLLVILSALALDSVARQFVVLASEYYRIIDIPIAWFGFIGAAMSLLGILNAKLSRRMVSRQAPFTNLLWLSAVLMLGFIGITFVVPLFGVVFAVAAFSILGMVSYQSSYYINKEVDSAHRATVLSFRGLALNLGLGLASLFYTGLIAAIKTQEATGLADDVLRETVFTQALPAFPLYFLVLLAGVLLVGRLAVSKRDVFFRRPTD